MKYLVSNNVEIVELFGQRKPVHTVDRVSVTSPIVIAVLMDTMARDRAHMYLFSV